MKIVPVETLSQVEQMRLIYNDNLEALSTRPLPYRTYEEQIKWWEGVDRQRVKAWLHYDDKPYRLIGFSMLTSRGDYATPMFAIRKEEQGKGYGWSFIRHYIEKAAKPLAGEQLQSNTAICHMNAKLGWHILDSENGVDYLFHPGNPDSINNMNEDAADAYLLNAFNKICTYHEERMASN